MAGLVNTIMLQIEHDFKDFKDHLKSEIEQNLKNFKKDEPMSKTDDVIIEIKCPNKKSSTLLRDIQSRYSSGFTMHALNHIQDGTLLERIVWILKLVVLLGAAVYISWGIFTAYFERYTPLHL